MSDVVRGPDGKFRSASDISGNVSDIDEPETFTGALQYTIPAADLTTGRDEETVAGEEAIIIDFTEYLGSDEVFVMYSADLEVQIKSGRTATAEHVLTAQYSLRTDGSGPLRTLATGQDTSEGIADVYREQSDSDDLIFTGNITGGGDFADSAAGLAAGGSHTHTSHSISYPEIGLAPMAFDQDDELYIPAHLEMDGSDDQTADFLFAVTVRGKTYDL